jgi:hypothetical protein
MQITRFTNMQNPLHDRDFWANDEVQQRLQNESFATDFWYEKRRDEFRLTEEQQKKLGIRIISNAELIAAYCAFQLQSPFYATQHSDKFFISKRDDKDGLYEEIFNNKTKFNDIISSYIIYELARAVLMPSKEKDYKSFEESNWIAIMPVIALSKIVMQKYYKITRGLNNGKEFNLNLFINKTGYSDNDDDLSELLNLIVYSSILIAERLKHDNPDKSVEKIRKLMNNPTFYESMRDEIEENDLNIEAARKTDSFYDDDTTYFMEIMSLIF